MLWTLEGRPSRSAGPIRIVDSNYDDSDDQPFFEAVLEALALIRSLDLRRLRRVESEIRFIINTELTSLATYDPVVRACRLDFNGLRVFRQRLGQEWLVAQVATTLIHEATHGYLFQRGFTARPEHRRRAERLCVLEEQRFADRVDERVRNAHPLVYPFDEKRWYPYWYASRWNQIRSAMARLREARRDAKARKGKAWVDDEQHGEAETAEHSA